MQRLCMRRCSISSQRRFFFEGIVNGVKTMFKQNRKDVEVLTKDEAKRRINEQNKQQRANPKEAFNQMIDQSIGKSRGMSGFLLGKVAKFFAGRMIDMASKQVDTIEYVTDEAVAMLELNSKVRAVIGENIAFEMIQGYNSTVMNSTSGLELNFSVVGSKGRGLIELKAEDMAITSLKCTGRDGRSFHIAGGGDSSSTAYAESSSTVNNKANYSNPQIIDVQSWEQKHRHPP